jgi:hypothetical protein
MRAAWRDYRKGIVTVCFKNKYICSFIHSFKISEPNIRLTSLPYRGYLLIKDSSTWRYVSEKNWDVNRENMLCRHLGFKETDAKHPETNPFRLNYRIAIGDLICYNTQPSVTSCCVHLVPSIASSNVQIPYVRCKYDITVIIIYT